MSKVEANQSGNIGITWVPNVYVNYIKDGIIYWNQFAYVSDGNKLLYCLEINKSIIRYDYSLYDFSIQNYPLEVRRDLELINYYGFEYEGHQNLYYYMATQELIWNKLGVQIYWTTEGNGKGTIINIDSYKNEIMNLYNNYFNVPNIIIPDMKVGSSNEFIDSNNVLKEFDVIYNGKNTIRTDGNKLVIDAYFLGNDTLSLKRKSNNLGETKVYKSANSQTLVNLGNMECDNKTHINFNVYGGSISILRIDSKTLTNVPSNEASIEGAQYSIYDTSGNVLNTLSTNSNGIISINNLALGEYIIKENSPSIGYYPDLNEYHIFLSFGSADYTLMHTASVIGQDLKINLHYENDEPASNITFDIYNKNGLVKSVTTDSNGYALAYLLYGTYEIKQSNVKEGYKKTIDFEFATTEESSITSDLYNDKEIKEIVNETPNQNEEIKEIPNQGELFNQESVQKLPLLFEKSYNNCISYGLILLSILIKILLKKYA
jgi:hypothetical protein